MDLTPEQARVIGSLVEKAGTTPDSYPLSSNALTNACNQTTNRDPVVSYTERDVDALMIELREMKLARTVHGSGHRVGKHKHVVDEALGLDGHELAVLAVLLLRGPQTRNEIVTRTERYADGPAGDADAVDAAIDRLASRPEPLADRPATRLLSALVTNAAPKDREVEAEKARVRNPLPVRSRRIRSVRKVLENAMKSLPGE